MKFICQTINGKVRHDFVFELVKACEYQIWYDKSVKHVISYCEIEDLTYSPNWIPVGTVEFVLKYLEFYNLFPKPKNIPTDLFWENNLERYVTISPKDWIKSFPCFAKSETGIKKFTGIIHNEEELKTIPDDFYIVSQIIDIESEWRGFVYKGKLVGLQNYSGDFKVFPNVPKIESMIAEYKTAPVAYTIDVAVSGGKTVLIEVHDFFSCGLYGFADYRILPQMFGDWFKQYTRGNKV